MSRLSRRPGEVIDRSRPVEFTWNGRAMAGFEGDTIASALVAGGVRIVSRSMKYHRPRGYMTNDYWDPNGLVQVGDDPNVRSAHRLIEPGMNVDPQNAWPSLDRDLKAINGLMSRFLTAGFYYKTFMRPRWLWPVYEKVLTTFAPGGRIDLDTPHRYHDKRYTHPRRSGGRWRPGRDGRRHRGRRGGRPGAAGGALPPSGRPSTVGKRR